jgi:SAM-dependent methyltransferase
VRTVRFVHWLVGAAGLGALRSWLGADGAAAEGRIADVERLVRARAEDPLLALEVPLPEVDARAGYAAWAATYDELPNPLIRVEEPVVRRLLDAAPPGRALDAACGTGRHAAHLLARGHRVTAVDASAEMLARARTRAPGAMHAVGALAALPLTTASVDLAVCALALMHVPELRPAVAELARVVRPGGRIVLSDLHPTALLLGGGALFQGADGGFGVVRGWVHRHEDYVAAFVAAGLEIRACLEPAWTAAEIALLAGPFHACAPEALHAAFVGFPAALVWELRAPAARQARGSATTGG